MPDSRKPKSSEKYDTAITAHIGTSGIGMSAMAMLRFAGIAGEQSLADLVAALKKRVEAVNDGEMEDVEVMLMGQAIALQAVFASLANRAALNAGEHLQATETYMKLALRAQSQCRATLETLATIKNPPLLYARQANVTTGPQQINNGVAREIESSQIQLSGTGHELLPDDRAPRVASQNHPLLATVGAIHRSEDGGRKGAISDEGLQG